MPDFDHFALFLVAAIVLVVTPGPAVIYIVTRSVDQGRRAGIASVLSVGIGNFAHVIGAAAGLSTLLAASALAFSMVKYAGAAYLVYLGIRKLLSRPAETEPGSLRRRSRRSVFRDGIVVAVLNPKTALFFLAFLPQFTDPTCGSVPAQFVMLGSITVLLGIASDSCYALLSGAIGNSLRQSKTLLVREKYISGVTYCGLGIATALSGSGNDR